MIPWLLVAELVSLREKPLSSMVSERIERFPCSGEINRKLSDPKAAIAAVQQHFADQSPVLDDTDGLSMSFDDWRVNIRMSNTEPVLRLNVESRNDIGLMQQRTREILDLIEAY